MILKPSESIIFNHEKLKAKEEAGIINIIKKIKLPIKPSPFDKVTKVDLPKFPPLSLPK